MWVGRLTPTGLQRATGAAGPHLGPSVQACLRVAKRQIYLSTRGKTVPDPLQNHEGADPVGACCERFHAKRADGKIAPSP